MVTSNIIDYFNIIKNEQLDWYYDEQSRSFKSPRVTLEIHINFLDNLFDNFKNATIEYKSHHETLFSMSLYASENIICTNEKTYTFIKRDLTRLKIKNFLNDN